MEVSVIAPVCVNESWTQGWGRCTRSSCAMQVGKKSELPFFAFTFCLYWSSGNAFLGISKCSTLLFTFCDFYQLLLVQIQQHLCCEWPVWDDAHTALTLLGKCVWLLGKKSTAGSCLRCPVALSISAVTNMFSWISFSCASKNSDADWRDTINSLCVHCYNIALSSLITYVFHHSPDSAGMC